MRLFLEGFLLGNASILTNVCLLPLYPGMIAYLAGQQATDGTRRNSWLGAVVLAGVFSMLLVIGMLFSVLSGLYTNALPVIVLASYALVVGLGVMMLLGYNPFVRVRTIQSPVFQSPVGTAYVYGLLLAPMTLPCTGGLLLAALGRVAGLGALVSEMVFLIAFSLGFGWPLVLLPLIHQGAQQRFLGWMTRNHRVIERAAGLLLVAIGVYGLVVDSIAFGVL